MKGGDLMKKIILSSLVVLLASMALTTTVLALFEETVKVTGSTFKVATDSTGEPEDTENGDLKILVNLGSDSNASNLADSVTGPLYDNISNSWTADYPIKLHNQGNKTLSLISKADYINDVNVLRDDIYVEVFAWNDTNTNGTVDTGELGQSYAKDTILRWRNDTFEMGRLLPNETRGFVLRFDGSGITDSNLGMEAVFDFEFTGTEVTN